MPVDFREGVHFVDDRRSLRGPPGIADRVLHTLVWIGLHHVMPPGLVASDSLMDVEATRGVGHKPCEAHIELCPK